MASTVCKIYLVVVLVVMLWVGTEAQSGCTRALVGLSPCLNYVSGNSSTPSSSCCSQLSSVVQSQPQCLCSLLNGGASSLGITINQTLALALPNVCNVQTPPLSRCSDSNGGTTAAPPASSPAESPEDYSDDVPDSDIPSGTESKTIPKTDGAFAGGSNIKTPFNFVGVLLFVASCALSARGF